MPNLKKKSVRNNIRNNTLCNTYDPCRVSHLYMEAKRRKVVATKYSKSSTIKDFMQMCRTGVKEVKVNRFQCPNFVSFASLKNSSILNNKDLKFPI